MTKKFRRALALVLSISLCSTMVPTTLAEEITAPQQSEALPTTFLSQAVATAQASDEVFLQCPDLEQVADGEYILYSASKILQNIPSMGLVGQSTFTHSADEVYTASSRVADQIWSFQLQEDGTYTIETGGYYMLDSVTTYGNFVDYVACGTEAAYFDVSHNADGSVNIKTADDLYLAGNATFTLAESQSSGNEIYIAQKVVLEDGNTYTVSGAGFEALVASIAVLNQDFYTVDSWDVLQDTLVEAQEDAEAATALAPYTYPSSQSETLVEAQAGINQAASLLYGAVSALESTTDTPTEAITPVVTVDGYQQVTIDWSQDGGVTSGYRLYRGEDGVFTLLSEEFGTSYQDTAVDTTTRYSYRVDFTDASGNTVTGTQVEMSQAADLAALQQNAIVNYDLAGITFDGATTLDKSEDIALLQDVSEGSLIIRAKFDGTPTGGTTVNGIIEFDGSTPVYMGLEGTRARYDFGNGLKSYVGASTTDFSDGWFTFIMTVEGGAVKCSINGDTSQGSYTDDKWAGFLSRNPEMTAITLGGGDNVANWVGEIAYIIVTDQILTQEQVAEITTPQEGKNSLTQLFNTDPDNTWVFTGSDEIKSSVESSAGARTFVGHFEEYIRWTIGSSTQNTRQRYVFSAIPSQGISLAEVNAYFYNYVAMYQPKGVGIMPDDQDFDTDLDSLKEDLQGIIDQLYAMGAVPVLITPYASNDGATNEKIAAIVEMMEEVSQENMDADQEITLVDLYNGADTAYLNEDDTLNADGHYAVGALLVKATTGGDMSFTGFGTEVVAEALVDVDVAPVVVTDGDTVTVSLPADYQDVTQATYSFTMGNKTLSGLLGTSFTFEGLTEGEAFSLEVEAPVTNGDIHVLNTVSGTVGGEVSAQPDGYTEGILDGRDSVGILFIGDSITHGALHTYGYASVPQLFEKALTEIGMGDSIILNSAVSSANAGTSSDGTLSDDYKPYRMDRYLDGDGLAADIVIIMLGTNDCVVSGMTEAAYKANLETIIDEVRAVNATPVLRTPNPVNDSLGSRAANLPLYVEQIRQVAEEMGVLLVDHYAEWSELMEGDMPYLINGTSNKVWLNDGLHPNPNGQLNMFTSLFEAVAGTDALNQSQLSKLSYTYDVVETAGTNLSDYIIATADSLTLDTQALQAGTAQTLEQVTMSMEQNGQTCTYTSDNFTDLLTMDGLSSQTGYAITVRATYSSGYDQGYFLCFDDVTLYTEADIAPGTSIDVTVTAQPPYAVGDTMGTLSYTQDDVLQQEAVFTLVDSATHSDNLYFTIEGHNLVIMNPIAKGASYQLAIQAEANGQQDILLLTIEAPVEEGTLYYNSNLYLTDVSMADPFSAQELTAMQNAQDMTIVVQFKQDNNAYGALFSLSDPTNANCYFSLIVYDSTLVVEHRETGRDDLNNKVNSAWPTPLAADEINTVALRATENQGYDLFVNGELVQQVVLDEASYLAPGEISNIAAGYVGKTYRSTAANGYPFLGSVYEIQVYDHPLSDEELLERTAATPKVTPAYRDDFINVFEAYLSENNTDGSTAANAGSNYFRIPSLLSTQQGTLIAATDLRYGGTADSANNLDIGVRTRTAGETEWNDVIAPAYFGDFSNATHIMNSSSSYTYNNASASFIDPVLVEDTMFHDSRIFMVTDAFVSGGGSGSHSYYGATSYPGSGFVEIDGQSYWKLQKEGESGYNYYVDAVNLDEDGMRTIYRLSDNTPLEDYKLTSFFEVVYQGEVQTVAQRSTTYDYDTNTITQTGYSGEDVPMNIMYDSSEFTVYPTMYLYMFYSDDQGETWSHPTNITGMVKPDDYGFFGVGPGVGIQIQQGEYKGRILIPTYTYVTGGQSTGTIYSDDGGVTWHKGELVNLTNDVTTMSEAQYVELPDGSIRVYARTTGSYVGYATSLDGGVTWSDSQYDTGLPHIGGSGCQISVINYSQPIDGLPAVIFSGPTGSSRTNGSIRIGLIEDTGLDGADRYQITWRYEEQVITYDPDRTSDDPTYGRSNYFAYSCLTELPNGDIGLIYETTNLRQPLEDAIRYTEYTLAELMDSTLGGEVTATYDVVYRDMEGTYLFDLAVVYDAPVRLSQVGEMTLSDGVNSYSAISLGSDDNQTFRFYAQLPAGDYTATYSNPVATSEQGVLVETVLGSIAVGEATNPYDLNGDGVVSYSDITVIIPVYGYPVIAGADYAKCDVDGNGKIGSEDYLAVYKKINSIYE